jgi:hypothetical protein
MIQTKVARIIDPTLVVLAAGENDGVKEGMEFVIYDLSDQILDPETKEDLGRIELVKGRVVAEHVQDKITIARTPSRQVERTINPLAGLLAASSLWTQTVKENIRDQLKVEGAVAIQKDQIVRVGDLVRSVTETAPITRYVTI